MTRSTVFQLRSCISLCRSRMGANAFGSFFFYSIHTQGHTHTLKHSRTRTHDPPLFSSTSPFNLSRSASSSSSFFFFLSRPPSFSLSYFCYSLSTNVRRPLVLIWTLRLWLPNDSWIWCEILLFPISWYSFQVSVGLFHLWRDQIWTLYITYTCTHTRFWLVIFTEIFQWRQEIVTF